MNRTIQTADQVEQVIVARILAANGVGYDRILPPQKGYRNASYPVMRAGAPPLNVIIFKREPGIAARIRRADAVSDYLAEQGFPTRQSQSRIIALQPKPHKTDDSTSRPTRYARCYDYLPGETIPWEAYTMKRLKLIGKTLSDLHATLQAYPRGNIAYPSILDENRALTDAMQHYFDSDGVRAAMKTKLRLTLDHDQTTGSSGSFRVLFDLLDHPFFAHTSHILHMDFVRGNILFSDTSDETEITGILDFEKTAFGPRICDIARTLAFLIVDCKYKSAQKIWKYFIGSGYQKRGGATLSAYELRTLKPLITFYLLHDFYKFLKHNPYESLYANEHYVRTRDILIKNGIIKQIP